MQVHMEIFTKDALAPSLLLDKTTEGVATISDLKQYVAAHMNIHEKHFVFILTSFNIWGEGKFDAQQVVHDTWPLADLIPHGKHRLVPYELAVGLEDTFGFFFKVFCVGIPGSDHPVQLSRRMEFLASLSTPCPPTLTGVKRTYSEVSMNSVASSQEDPEQAAKPGESGSTQAASSSASGLGSTQAASSTGSGPSEFDADSWGDASGFDASGVMVDERYLFCRRFSSPTDLRDEFIKYLPQTFSFDGAHGPYVLVLGPRASYPLVWARVPCVLVSV